MSKTAQMILKIIGASLALAAFICLLIGGWNDLAVAGRGLKARVSNMSKKNSSEYDDYNDDALYE